jgi:general secretion pathway protein E
VPPNELRYLLRSVLVQRLLRMTCANCQGEGCKACRGTGYDRREIVSECAYFPSEEEVGEMLDGKSTWPSMLEDAVSKCVDGKTDEKELVRDFGEEGRMLLEKHSRGDV